MLLVPVIMGGIAPLSWPDIICIAKRQLLLLNQFRLNKCFFWIGDIRSGSQGFWHYIYIYSYLKIIIKKNYEIIYSVTGWSFGRTKDNSLVIYLFNLKLA